MVILVKTIRANTELANSEQRSWEQHRVSSHDLCSHFFLSLSIRNFIVICITVKEIFANMFWWTLNIGLEKYIVMANSNVTHTQKFSPTHAFSILQGNTAACFHSTVGHSTVLWDSGRLLSSRNCLYKTPRCAQKDTDWKYFFAKAKRVVSVSPHGNVFS